VFGEDLKSINNSRPSSPIKIKERTANILSNEFNIGLLPELRQLSDRDAEVLAVWEEEYMLAPVEVNSSRGDVVNLRELAIPDLYTL
jgi:hypothetical protein